jgi:hypothetical protein
MVNSAPAAASIGGGQPECMSVLFSMFVLFVVSWKVPFRKKEMPVKQPVTFKANVQPTIRARLFNEFVLFSKNERLVAHFSVFAHVSRTYTNSTSGAARGWRSFSAFIVPDHPLL